ncbi:E3 ubiquitin-protein ligase, partial [Smittium culicis]
SSIIDNSSTEINFYKYRNWTTFSSPKLSNSLTENIVISESLVDISIFLCVNIILQIDSPYQSHLFSKEVTVLLSDSILCQLVSANTSSFNLKKYIEVNPENYLPSNDTVFSTSGYPIKMFLGKTSEKLKQFPPTIVSNAKVFNPSYEFLTVLSILPTKTSSGVYSFSVVLLSSGLMQIGWCSGNCDFYSIVGKGIGDDFESVAYDGFRQRRWYGTSSRNSYGEKWDAGDVISSSIDLNLGTVEFFRNGKSLGIAFGPGAVDCSIEVESIPKNRMWYPAASLSSNQAVQFLPFCADP